jgi:hypothetical protein
LLLESVVVHDYRPDCSFPGGGSVQNGMASRRLAWTRRVLYASCHQR